MTTLRFHIDVHLQFLRDFLDHLERDVALEWAQIEKRNQNGDFPEYEDYEAAMDFPLFREKFSARAIINELNALVEEVLQSKAEPAWRLRHGKTEMKNIPSPVWEQRFGKIWELIEAYYGIRGSDIPGWDVYDKLRDMANAFKHRRGFRRFSNIFKKGVLDSSEAQYRATFENARSLLDGIKPFLIHVSSLKPKSEGS
jgi:hypothetical protein